MSEYNPASALRVLHRRYVQSHRVNMTIHSYLGSVLFQFDLEILDIFFKGVNKKGKPIYSFFYRSRNIMYKYPNERQWRDYNTNMDHVVRSSIDTMRRRIKTYFGVQPHFHNVGGAVGHRNYEAKKRKKEEYEMFKNTTN